MKNINKILFIPLFAALAVSCSSPVAFQSSEYDDVYYTSKDKTIIQDGTVASAATTAPGREEVVQEDAVPNPEYSEKNSGTGNVYSNRDNGSADDYYSDDYLYSSQLRRNHAPYRSGLSYYDLAYTDYYWYNRSPLLYGRSAFYDPFFSPYAYDPFYSPYYDYGFRSPRIYTGLTVVIGQPYYGGFYGRHPYYGGFNRGMYGGGFYGGGFNNSYYANSGWYRNDTNSASKVQYGPRRERSEVPNGNANTNGGARPRNDMGGVNSGGGGIVVPDGGRGTRPADADVRSTRSRSAGNDTAPAPGVDGARRNTAPDMAQPADAERPTRVGRQGRTIENLGDNQVDPAPAQPNLERPSRRNRVEPNTEYTPDQPVRSMEERPSIRPRNDRNAENYTPAPSRQQQRREEAAPQEQRREYQPQQRMERQERAREMYRPEPSYQAPRQERSYEAPRTYEQPSSRPAPSSGGSNDGGGRSGRSRDQ